MNLPKDTKFFYSSGTMGFYGHGYWWHRFFHFPELPVVLKTITLHPKKGHPYLIVPLGKSVWNHVGLANPGLLAFMVGSYIYEADTHAIVSIHGTDTEIEDIVGSLEKWPCSGIELNFSCPNVRSHENIRIPKSKHPLYLKLSCKQDAMLYDLSRIEGIRLNSVPMFGGGVSGKLAQKENWAWIKRFSGLQVAGCSFTSTEDILRLYEYYGVREFGIGSVMLTNPRLVERLGQ